MKIETGHPVSADVAPVAGDRVRFVTDDGRTIFEVTCGKDEHSIDVRGVNTFKVGKVVYDGCLDIRPQCGNAVSIQAALRKMNTFPGPFSVMRPILSAWFPRSCFAGRGIILNYEK